MRQAPGRGLLAAGCLAAVPGGQSRSLAPLPPAAGRPGPGPALAGGALPGAAGQPRGAAARVAPARGGGAQCGGRLLAGAGRHGAGRHAVRRRPPPPAAAAGAAGRRWPPLPLPLPLPPLLLPCTALLPCLWGVAARLPPRCRTHPQPPDLPTPPCSWLPEHPGGSRIIPQQSLNLDCARFFELYHASRESFLYLQVRGGC